ncbi:MAG: hypothetical protein UV73_C0004G0163 [Candidatus Gottesmanbacteria bacterium GW2011_GWA2_43_14]|uniref:Uncharacterized protein n=1 Tax=Candidatus Gottesmanbacteria bacterium GW2011_GWA2_43_14 TaxID=1618443 RepID=A0A0G1FSM5_9BACT|nr:MAG: hypothetical protein UV73_C0004G0163 [Candidatus Gottesmanbacteria bacterium GW2011_GWA2_43_14]
MTDKKVKENKLHVAVLKQMVTLSTSAFGLVMALAWNNVIQETVKTYIEPYLSKGSSLFSLLIYALLITVLGVFVTLQLSKAVKKVEDLTTAD